MCEKKKHMTYTKLKTSITFLTTEQFCRFGIDKKIAIVSQTFLTTNDVSLREERNNNKQYIHINIHTEQNENGTEQLQS